MVSLFTLYPADGLSLFADVRNIIADDDSLQQGIAPALREYNLAQFITVDVPGSNHQVSIKVSMVDGRALNNSVDYQPNRACQRIL